MMMMMMMMRRRRRRRRILTELSYAVVFKSNIKIKVLTTKPLIKFLVSLTLGRVIRNYDLYILEKKYTQIRNGKLGDLEIK